MAPRSTLHTARRTGLALAAGALLISAAGAPAWAAPGDISLPDSTTANVNVEGAISLTGLPASVELTGIPGALVESDPVTYTVTTNNQTGYSVAVTPDDDELLPADTLANTEAIPIGVLTVREGASDGYTSMINGPKVIHTQPNKSAGDGDPLRSQYRITIPFANEDTYSVDLTYIATAI